MATNVMSPTKSAESFYDFTVKVRAYRATGHDMLEDDMIEWRRSKGKDHSCCRVDTLPARLLRGWPALV